MKAIKQLLKRIDLYEEEVLGSALAGLVFFLLVGFMKVVVLDEVELLTAVVNAILYGPISGVLFLLLAKILCAFCKSE